MFVKLYLNQAKKAISAAVAGLLLLPSFAWAQVPTDPGYDKQESMWNQIKALDAWQVTTGTRSVVIASIDTGMDTWHDDLRAAVWTNVYEIPENGIDDDGNGYVDDVHGWNFVEGSNDVRTSVFGEKDRPDAVDHGTIVAGLMAAQMDNGVAGVGLAPGVAIMPLRALDSTGGGSFASVVEAINYAVDNGANVISMSFEGKEPNHQLYLALYQAYQRGVVIVAAAGNNPTSPRSLDDSPTYPACFDSAEDNWILTVASVNKTDHLSSFSDFGSCIDITAPGEGIFSTMRYSPQYGYTKDFDGGWNGTSFAAPLVAATAALIKTIHPQWTPSQIINAILTHADSVDAVNSGYEGKIGVGRLNVGAVIAAAIKLGPVARSPIYYVAQKKLLSFDPVTKKSQAVATVPSGQILAYTVTDASKMGFAMPIFLVRRGSQVGIVMLRENGQFWQEFRALDTFPASAAMATISVSINDGLAIYVAGYNTKTRLTSVWTYSTSGLRQDAQDIKGKIKQINAYVLGQLVNATTSPARPR